MKRACIVSVGNLLGFADRYYGIEWNDACELFSEYYISDGYIHLEPMCAPEDPAARAPIGELNEAETASRIVEEFIDTLDVPEGYDLMIEG